MFVAITPSISSKVCYLITHWLKKYFLLSILYLLPINFIRCPWVLVSWDKGKRALSINFLHPMNSFNNFSHISLSCLFSKSNCPRLRENMLQPLDHLGYPLVYFWYFRHRRPKAGHTCTNCGVEIGDGSQRWNQHIGNWTKLKPFYSVLISLWRNCLVWRMEELCFTSPRQLLRQKSFCERGNIFPATNTCQSMGLVWWATVILPCLPIQDKATIQGAFYYCHLLNQIHQEVRTTAHLREKNSTWWHHSAFLNSCYKLISQEIQQTSNV